MPAAMLLTDMPGIPQDKTRNCLDLSPVQGF